MFKYLLCYFFAFLICSNSIATKEVHQEEKEMVIYNLYKNYSWQAIFLKSKFKNIAEQPYNELNKYFDDELSRLIALDNKCLQKNLGQVCKLNFDIIFASQDPKACDLRINYSKNGNIQVLYSYPSTSEKIILEYKIEHKKNGWKIVDILYKNNINKSLKDILMEN